MAIAIINVDTRILDAHTTNERVEQAMPDAYLPDAKVWRAQDLPIVRFALTAASQRIASC